MFSGSLAAPMINVSIAGRNAEIVAAICGSICKLTQLSKRTIPVGNNSIFLEAIKIKWIGLTIVMDLQDTARVRIFSPKTKYGTGNVMASRVQLTLDL